MQSISGDGGDTGRAPLITVGVPVYNGERFLDRSLGSIRLQTLDDFELIIADNCSTDGTLEICQRHASEDPRIRILTSECNRGAAWNFNRLVPEARGRFFKWAAADDVLEPEFLSRCAEILESEPGVSLCYTGATDIDESGAVICPIAAPGNVDHDRAAARVRRLLRFDLSCVETFGLMRTEALRTTRLIGAYTSSDRTLLLELAIAGRFHHVDKNLLRRRQHESRSVRANARDRNAWFDPSRRDAFTFPQWRLVGEFVRAVRRAPTPAWDRLEMIASVARWGAARWRRLGREAVAGVAHRAGIGRRQYSAARTSTPAAEHSV